MDKTDMQIVAPTGMPPTPKAMVRWKAVVFTAVAVVWGLVSVGAVSFDLSPELHGWHTMRIVIWIVQCLLAAAAVWFWLRERPRPMKDVGLPEPPVIHSS